MFYDAGAIAAFEKIGISTGGLREGLLNALRSKQYGEFMTRMPIQMTTGGALGAATGSLSDNPWAGAGIGALGGLTSGFSVAAAPRFREMLIKRLKRVPKTPPTNTEIVKVT